MKIKLSITEILAVRTATLSAGLFLILIGHLSAQSADVFQSLQGKTQITASGSSTNSPPDLELLKSKSSRFAVGFVDLYVAARIADLSMKNRATDPFGLYQDPELKPEIKNPGLNKPRHILTNVPAVPLSEIVVLFKVSTIMVKEKSFQIKEGRIFKELEEFEIVHNGREKRLKIMKVEAEKIFFKDLASGEEATLKTEVLPFGMSTGDNKMRPAGMVSPTDQEPLILEIK